MAKEKAGSAKRYGVRYGRANREKVAKVESLMKKPQKCPYCKKSAVKRISVGIWNCLKCGSKFTGQAYNATSMSASRLADRRIDKSTPVQSAFTKQLLFLVKCLSV